MPEPSHYVRQYRSLVFSLDPDVRQIIDGEIGRYRNRCKERDVTYAASLATEVYQRYDNEKDSGDLIGATGRTALIVGLMNALCQIRLERIEEPTTCAILQQLCPSIEGKIERVYSLLDPELRASREICGYNPLKQLGVGGHGSVFEVTDRANRHHALKFALWNTIEADLISHEEDVLVQLRSLPETLHHRLPLDCKLEANYPDHIGLRMPLIVGRNLASYLTDRRAAWKEVRFVGFEMLRLLHAIHQRGFLHLDLKPANICLRSSTDTEDDASLDDPVLIDFGLARSVDIGNQPIKEVTPLGGTEAFSSPEQKEGTNVGVTSDIYSLGGTLGYALTGVAPNEPNRFEEALRNYEASNPKASKFVSAILHSVADDPADRFKDAAEFRDAIWPQMSPRAIRNRKRLKRTSAVIAACILVFGLSKFFKSGRIGPPTWIDLRQTESGVDLADYGIDQFRFYPDFLEYERAGYYKSGFLTVQTPKELGPFIKGLEIKFANGPWNAPMSTTDTGAGYIVASDQVRDGIPLQMRFDTVPGEGVGKVYGPRMETKLDLETIRERQLTEWRNQRREFELKADKPQYVFKFDNGWKPTEALLEQAWEIRDIVLYEEGRKDSVSVSLRDCYIDTGAYAKINNPKDQLETMCNCMPDEYRHAPLLHFVIEYRADPNLWEDEFWKLHRIHTLNRMVWTDEAPAITDGNREFIVPQMIDEKNEVVASMVKGYSAQHWEFTDQFINEGASTIAEIYFTTSVFGEEDEPRYRLAVPQDKPTRPSAWTADKRFYVKAGNYDATCIYIRAVFIDGTSSEHIRHRVDHDTEYFDQRRWIAITYDAPEILRRDVDIGEQLRYIKGAELQRINHGK